MESENAGVTKLEKSIFRCRLPLSGHCLPNWALQMVQPGNTGDKEPGSSLEAMNKL